jgi:uncharacterized protein YbbC (DUF1343 family)
MQSLHLKIRKTRKSFPVFILVTSLAILGLGASPFVEKMPLFRGGKVLLGNDVFLKRMPSEVKGKRLGLVINHTSCLSDRTDLVTALLNKGADVQTIFTPEHGLSGNVEGGITIDDGKVNDIPVFSLYGKTRKPTLRQVKDIDVFIYDIQDVGARFYTYISTLKYILEAAAEFQKSVIVLDRPNPVGGIIIEGPLMKKKYESFIGSLPIPIRYGLTAGELALMMKGEGWVPDNVDLNIIKMKNWKRKYFWTDTGLSWIPSSPNIPDPEITLIYPGTGLLEAGNLNEGRGTPNPFLQFGAPWFHASRFIQTYLSSGSDLGIELEEVVYKPQLYPGKANNPLYVNRTCHGILVRIKNKSKFLSFRFVLMLLEFLKNEHPEKLSSNERRLNLMYGTNDLTRYLRDQISYLELLERAQKDEALFREQRQKYLLYK